MLKVITGLLVMLILALAAACTREVEKIVVVTATPAGTPTMTAQELAYVEAVATAQSEATVEARVHATETVEARPTKTPRPTRTPKPPPYKLALISSSCVHSYGIEECEGFVKNISNEPLESIKVTIIWVDTGGVPRASDWSFVDYDPLLPGQESPWSVFGDYNPELTRYRVQFSAFLGGTILTRDDRQ